MRLRIALDPRLAALHPGGRVAGTVTTGDGGPARAVEAWLEFTETAGGHEHVAARTGPVRLHAGPLPPGHDLRLALRVPPDAVPSLRTPWGALRWAVVVRNERTEDRDLREEVDLEVLA